MMMQRCNGVVTDELQEF